MTFHAIDYNNNLLKNSVMSSFSGKLLFLFHAIPRMSRSDRMITTMEAENIVKIGLVISHWFLVLW